MLDEKIKTLLKVAELKNFTKAAESLSLTQPAVSNHIQKIENEFNTTIFIRKKGDLLVTEDGEMIIKYAKTFEALHNKLKEQLVNPKNRSSKLRIGITHTSESNIMSEVLAKCVNHLHNISITIITDTIKNLYYKLDNFEIDIAIIEGKNTNQEYNSLMLDTDYLVCAMANTHPLSSQQKISLKELKKEKLILRLPSSATRILFESTLESISDSIDNFNVIIEVDNIATIKDLIRKELGISILPKSACLDEIQKKKIIVLPIENLNMIRETNIVYRNEFSKLEILQDIANIYHETLKSYQDESR